MDIIYDNMATIWACAGVLNAIGVLCLSSGARLTVTLILIIVAFVSGLAGTALGLFFVVFPIIRQYHKRKSFAQTVHERRARRMENRQCHSS